MRARPQAIWIREPAADSRGGVSILERPNLLLNTKVFNRYLLDVHYFKASCKKLWEMKWLRDSHPLFFLLGK